ncbi:MAG: hypothetical protein IJ137_05715 [Eubacterium sp.]|nr:hypothetical protein [Eubacterium sp.]
MTILSLRAIPFMNSTRTVSAKKQEGIENPEGEAGRKRRQDLITKREYRRENEGSDA